MVADVRKGKLLTAYYYADKETTSGRSFICQLLDPGFAGPRFPRLLSALESCLELLLGGVREVRQVKRVLGLISPGCAHHGVIRVVAFAIWRDYPEFGLFPGANELRRRLIPQRRESGVGRIITCPRGVHCHG